MEKFSVAFLKSKKLESMKTKNSAMKNVVSLALGDLNTDLIGNKTGILKINNEEVSVEKYLEVNIATQLASLRTMLALYKKKNDVDNILKAESEIEFIENTFFPPLTEEETIAEFEKFKTNNNGATKKEWMDHLIKNYFKRYNGKFASGLFQ